MKPEIFEYAPETEERLAKLESIFTRIGNVISDEQMNGFENALGELRGRPIIYMMCCTYQALLSFNQLTHTLQDEHCVLSEEACVALEDIAELQRYLSGLIEMALVDEVLH